MPLNAGALVMSAMALRYNGSYPPIVAAIGPSPTRNGPVSS